MTLKELNFKKLISVDYDCIDNYSFDVYKKNGCKHIIENYCTLCEEENVNCYNDSEYKTYKLQNISHGAHSKDFLEALEPIIDTKDWHNDGVMFIMENPSKDYGIYDKDVGNGKQYKKNPSKLWYWIEQELKGKEYPIGFKRGSYGDLIESAILTFKLKNAYVTNVVKCGLNDENDNYKNTDYLQKKCIEKCIKEYLMEEIEIIKPKVIFAFGKNSKSRIDEFCKGNSMDKINVFKLPHPARFLEDEYFKTLYFCLMAKGLCKSEVISEKYYIEMMKKFLGDD